MVGPGPRIWRPLTPVKSIMAAGGLLSLFPAYPPPRRRVLPHLTPRPLEAKAPTGRPWLPHNVTCPSKFSSVMPNSVHGGEFHAGQDLSIFQLLHAARKKLHDTLLGGRCI